MATPLPTTTQDIPDAPTTTPYQSNFTPVPTNNYALPELPSILPTQRFNPVDPNSMTDIDRITRQYQNSLGRDPTQSQVDYWRKGPGGMNIGQVLNAISTSQEAQRSGRARNEVNTQVDSAIQQIARDLQTARMSTGNYLETLDPYYQSQLADLEYGYNTEFGSLEQALASARLEGDIGQRKLQDQIDPAVLNARYDTLRRGLIDSTITADRINSGLRPIYESMGDLTRQVASEIGDISSKKQALTEKTSQKRSSITSSRDVDIRNALEELNQLIQQSTEEASQFEAQRAPTIATRTGELVDQTFQQGLQSGNLDLLRKDLQERVRQFNEDLKYRREALAKQ